MEPLPGAVVCGKWLPCSRHCPHPVPLTRHMFCKICTTSSKRLLQKAATGRLRRRRLREAIPEDAGHSRTQQKSRDLKAPVKVPLISATNKHCVLLATNFRRTATLASQFAASWAFESPVFTERSLASSEDQEGGSLVKMTSIPITHNSSFPNSSQTVMSQGLTSSNKMGITILSIALAIGLPGNLFIIWTILAIMKNRTVTCVLILHLALADTVVLLTAPFFIHLLATNTWIFGSVICKICHYVGCLSMYASIFLIASMSLDRFLAVYKPFVSQKVRTKVVVMGIILGIWVLALFLSIPMPFYRKVISIPQPICCPWHSSPRHIIFQYTFETLFGFVIPFSAILTSYIYIGQRLTTAKFQRKRKTGRLITIIVVTFALFWLPYHSINVIQVLGNLSSGPIANSLKAAASNGRPTVTALAFLSSSINPILYAFAGSSFIKTAGLGFMAKLFEGTASEASSFRKASQAFQRQRSRNDSVEMEKMEVNPSSKSTATTMAR